jgi:hypothetical protein
MNKLAYSTSTGDEARGWDAFDAMVLWAASKRRTVAGMLYGLPAGIKPYLVRRSLEIAVADGLLFQMVDDADVRYLLTPTGRARLVPTNSRSDQAAA